jgi:tRNA/tmRNA/rRNA uracil-C5-methylase (TrmA/RlmC/RlmD family)
MMSTTVFTVMIESATYFSCNPHAQQQHLATLQHISVRDTTNSVCEIWP